MKYYKDNIAKRMPQLQQKQAGKNKNIKVAADQKLLNFAKSSEPKRQLRSYTQN